LGTMLQAVDGSIVNVAVPQIQNELGASLATVGWVVTGYALASLIAMPLSAGVAARVGVRAYFVAQVATFTLASVACAASRSAPTLIAFRILQGFSAGGLLPLSQGILMSLYPGERRGTAVALAGVAAVLGRLFGKRERTARSPAVDLSVLRYRPLAGTLAAAPLYGIGLYASIFLIPLLFERQLSMTAATTGLALAVGAVTSGVLIVCAQPL